MAPRTLILWLHVLCGLSWVGACASFVLAATALTGQHAERREFARRAAPRINRVGFGCAVLVPVTGLGNLAFALSERHFALSPEFIAIVTAKMLLFALMGWALWRATGIIAALRESPEGGAGCDRDEPIRRMMHCYGAIVGCGVAALLLGLWLTGL